MDKQWFRSLSYLWAAIAGLTCMLSAALAHGDELELHWVGNRDHACAKLVEAFLTELRALAPERSIEIDTSEPKTSLTSLAPGSRVLAIRCKRHDRPSADALEVYESRKLSVTLHYLAKASGFSATDWLLFQQKYLRENAVAPGEPNPALATAGSGPPPGSDAREFGDSSSRTSTGGKSLLANPWFWGIVGGVGAGVFGVTQWLRAQDRSDGNVRIH